MSKIIKPEDKELFGSAKKFKKEAFSLSIPQTEKQGNPGKRKAGAGNKETGGTREEKHNPDPVADAQKKAQQILKEAEAQAAEIRKRECEQGRADGLQQAREEMEREFEASKILLESLMDKLKAQESELMELLTPRLATLATELARKIIHREIESDSSIVTTQAEEAIGKILEREKLIIRVNPAEQELMKKHKPVLAKMFDGIDKIEVIGDPKVEQGGCVVETNLVRVDTQPSSQLEAARTTLIGEADAK